MGGNSFEEDCQIMSPLTLVLVGKTGNGKSATGNSILGMQMFQSKRSFSGVTKASELKTTRLVDGQLLNVIDTPGLIDSCLDIEKEIVSCMDKATDGVDAFLFVISVRSRFEKDEVSAISSMLTLFGRKFYDYMIIVFTGGDTLEDDECLEYFLRRSYEALQETLRLCGNRCVIFDNKTQDPSKRSNQVQKLLSLVNMVSKNNGGKPYTKEIFTELKEPVEQQISVYDEQFKRIYEMVESKVKETTLRLEQLLAEEQIAQLKAVENATASQKKSDKEIQKKWTRELDEHEMLLCKEQFKRIFEMVDTKLMETTSRLEQLLSEERIARLKAEENAKAAQKKSQEEILKFELKLKETTLKVEQLLAEKEIQKEGDSNEQHEKEQSEIELSVAHLVGLINTYKDAATSTDLVYEHITKCEKLKILNLCLGVETWLKEKKQVQESFTKHAHPDLLLSYVKRKAEEIDRVCRPIMYKPEPAPPRIIWYARHNNEKSDEPSPNHPWNAAA